MEAVKVVFTEGKMGCIDLKGTKRKRPSPIQRTILGSTGPGRSLGEWATRMGQTTQEDDGLNKLGLCFPSGWKYIITTLRSSLISFRRPERPGNERLNIMLHCVCI